jgi:hypothetical protein
MRPAHNAIHAYRSLAWQTGPYRKTLRDIAGKAMIDGINVPENDKLQVIAEHMRGLVESHWSSSVPDVRSSSTRRFTRQPSTFHAELKTSREVVVIKSVEAAKERSSRRGAAESDIMPSSVLSRDQTQGTRMSLRSIAAMAAAAYCK